MTIDEFIDYIEKRTAPFTLLETGRAQLSELFRKYPESLLLECVDIGIKQYLVLSYQNNGIESEITDQNGRHIILDKIIKNAAQNSTLSLSANTRRDMALFKDIGNYSAHKIWYNCTRQDIEPHIIKYRVIIEELMYKAGVK